MATNRFWRRAFPRLIAVVSKALVEEDLSAGGRSMLRLAVPVAVVVTALAFMESAESAETPLFNVHTDSLEANAGWQGAAAQVNVSGTNLAITNLSDNVPPPRQVSSSVHVCVELTARTVCADSDLSDDQLKIDANLGSAVLNAVVPAQECLRVAPFTCSGTSLQIDLTWTATSPLDNSSRFHNKIFAPEPCHINEIGTVSRRQAEISGSITDGTTDFIAGLNTVFAEIVEFRGATTGRGDPEVCL